MTGMRPPKMRDPDRDDILDPTLRPEERKRLLETAKLLEQARPIPRPSFRGELARQLRARSAGPQRLRLLVSAYAGAGLALLSGVAVGLGGIGPLAPG
jgi:hypothetical protein